MECSKTLNVINGNKIIKQIYGRPKLQNKYFQFITELITDM